MLLFFGIAAPLMARASDGMDASENEDFYEFFFSPSSSPTPFVPLQATEKHFRHLTDGCYPERLGGRRAFGCKALQGKDAKQLNAIRFCSMETNFDFIYSFSRNGFKQKSD